MYHVSVPRWCTTLNELRERFSTRSLVTKLGEALREPLVAKHPQRTSKVAQRGLYGLSKASMSLDTVHTGRT